MTTITGLIGRFHPLLVHLPIGMLLLALLFGAMSRQGRWRSLRPAVPFILLLGALAAAFSSLTGWLLSRNGEYENDLLSRHQWMGIAVAIVSFSAYWLNKQRFRAASNVFFVLLFPTILLTGHWGMVLTHGTNYLTKSAPPAEAGEPESVAAMSEIPAVEVSPPPAEAVAALQNAGVVVLPVGRGQSFLSLNFVNLEEMTPAIRQSLVLLRENIIWLKLSGISLNDSTLAVISQCKNLTKLYLDRTTAGDSSLLYLQKSERLVYLNLVGAKVTAKGLESLVSLPALRKLYVYQTSVKPGDIAALQVKLPRVQIDSGNYRVPVLATDTTMLPLTK